MSYMNVYQKNYATKRVKEICNEALTALEEKHKLLLAEHYCKYKVKIADVFVQKLKKGKLCLGNFLEANDKMQQEKIDFIEADLDTKKKLGNRYSYEAGRMLTETFTLSLSVPSLCLAEVLPGFKATQAALNKDFVETTKKMNIDFKEAKDKINTMCSKTIDTIMLGDDASQTAQLIADFETQIKQIYI